MTNDKRLTISDVEKALVSPGTIFSHPSEVAAAIDLFNNEKIAILKRWELDARALQCGIDENMGGGTQPPLDEINETLAILAPNNLATDDFGKAPTKI